MKLGFVLLLAVLLAGVLIFLFGADDRAGMKRQVASTDASADSQSARPLEPGDEAPTDSATMEVTREPLALPLPLVDPSVSNDPAMALLTVLVEPEGSVLRTPFEASVVVVTEADVRRGGYRMTAATSAPAGLLESVRVAAGEPAVFRVPVDTPLVVRASGSSSAQAKTTVQIPTETPEHRVVLRIPVGNDVRFRGRVVESTTGRGLAGARVSIRNGSWLDGDGVPILAEFADTHSEANGDFEIEGATWQRAFAFVEAPGFGPRLRPLVGAMNTTEERATIALPRSAAISGLAWNPETNTPFAGARVHVSAPLAELVDAEHARNLGVGGDVVLVGVVDAQGRYEVDDLPPAVHLSAALYEGATVIQAWSLPLRLEPGERRELNWPDTSGTTLDVQVLLDGKPHADVELWLVPPQGKRSAFSSGHVTRLFAGERSALDGSVRFTNVPAGALWLGPAASRDQLEFAPLIQELEVPEGAVALSATVHLERGQRISGRVLTADGERSSGTYVQTSSGVYSRTDSEGGFTLSPLAPGEHRILARGSGLARDAEPVLAQAGAEDVELRLRPGARVRGQLVATETGAPVKGSVYLTSFTAGPNGTNVGLPARADPMTQSEFAFEGVAPGLYDVLATGEGLITVVRDIEIAAGDDLELPLKAARDGLLRVQFDGPADKALTVTVTCDGLSAGWRELAGSEHFLVPVISGEVQISYGEPGTARAKLTVDVAHDATRALTLKLPE